MDEADIIDLRGIAKLLKVSSHTPNQWRQRELLPEPDPEFADLARPIWRVGTIIRWAKTTGRWPPGTAARPYPGHISRERKRLHRTPAETAEARVSAPPPEPSGFRTAEDVKATIPQVMFRPPEAA